MLAKLLLRILFLLVFLIAGCQSSRDSQIVVDENTNFSAFKSFSLFSRGSPFFNSQNLSDGHRNRIEQTIEASMEQQGLAFSKPDQADIIISYFYVGQGSLSQYNKAVRHCLTCSASERKQSNRYKPGSLVLDALDTTQQKSVWRSVLPPQKVRKKSAFEQEQSLKLAIQTALLAFPIKAVEAN